MTAPEKQTNYDSALLLLQGSPGGAISPHRLEDADVRGSADGDINAQNGAWMTIDESILRELLAAPAELRHRWIETRQRPLATARPVRRAILAHSLEPFGVGGGDKDAIDRHHATWKTISDSIW